MNIKYNILVEKQIFELRIFLLRKYGAKKEIMINLYIWAFSYL